MLSSRSLLCAVLALVCVCALPAGAAGQSSWRYAPALAPPPPPGVSPDPNPVPLGEVGQISFWAPNRGLLVTGGFGIVPAGVYAYDGISWHQLSSVCGGGKGRIAWAGPDEFWTVADQRSGQVTARGQDLEDLSLCHFVGHEVVGSYAMPIGLPDSYMEMDAAACLSAADCWFAGQDGPPPNTGSFHLHWNGSEVTAYYDPSDHAVASMTSFQGRIYEGLAIGAEDSYLSDEEEASRPGAPPVHPPVIRTIAPAGQNPLCSRSGEDSTFCDVFLFSEGEQLPLYAEHSPPDALGGFELAGDGSPLGAGATQLWAGANPALQAPAGAAGGKLTILRDAKGSWTQIAPTTGLSFAKGVTLGGSEANADAAGSGEPGADSIAPEPGTEAAWLSLSVNESTPSATVERLEADGHVTTVEHLPGAQDPVGFRGTAGPITCVASGDCWMATNAEQGVSGGWLFHLTDGSSPAANDDPLFDGAEGVIAYRPPDSGVPVIYPDGFAEDDSLANQQAPPVLPAPTEPAPAKPVKAKKAPPLVRGVKSKFLHHRELVLSFTLTARAHVQLIARRKSVVVAKTRKQTLRPGRHALSLTLNPLRWPTKLQFQAKPIASGPAPAGTGSESSGDTVGT